jgi:hypothetical protein
MNIKALVIGYFDKRGASASHRRIRSKQCPGGLAGIVLDS